MLKRFPSDEINDILFCEFELITVLSLTGFNF